MADMVPARLLKFQFDHSDRAAVPARIPFAENVNDKNLLFAGSIFSAAVLSAYYAATNLFRDKGYEGAIVASEASVKYLKPIREDGLARTCDLSEIETRPSGNRRVTVKTVVSDAKGENCAEITSCFVLKPDR